MTINVAYIFIMYPDNKQKEQSKLKEVKIREYKKLKEINVEIKNVRKYFIHEITK